MTAVVGARNLFKVDAGVVHALLQARYYDGSKGQFLSEDPVFLGDPKQQVLTDPQGLNSYSYANDNPITKSDPNGRFSIGLSYNGNLERGFGAYGANYGSSNLNLVVNPATWQAWVVQSNSGAINSGYMSNYQSAPDNGKAPFVIGLYGGRGLSVSFSPKMTNPNDIQGTEDSVNVNGPLVSIGAQGEESGNPTYSVSPGVKGVASFSRYPVYTQITGTYSVNQFANRAATQAASYYQAAIAGIQAQIGAIQSKINALKASSSNKTK
jgi:RHS repeat-associated protein